MGISDQYTKEIREQLKYSATWFPNVHISPGDVGIFQNNQYYNRGNLNDLGIPFEISPMGVQAEFDYSSRDSVSVQVKLAGSCTASWFKHHSAEAGVTIKFSRENAVLFELLNVKAPVLKTKWLLVIA